MDFDEILSKYEEVYLDLLLTGGLSEEADDQDEIFNHQIPCKLGK